MTAFWGIVFLVQLEEVLRKNKNQLAIKFGCLEK
jgi:hypothetical protein